MRKLLYIIIVLVAVCSCKRTPGYVIKTDEMSALLADMHMAEAVVENDYGSYSTDSSRMALKQAVLERHGVTLEQFDTSLVWYGHNIDEYLKAYDGAIALLKERQASASSASVLAMSIGGDSAEVWPGSRYMVLSDRLPSPMVGFDFKQDDNFERGDIYTFRIKVLDNPSAKVKWNIAADYDDGRLDVLTLNISPQQSGWSEVTFVSDSTRMLNRIRGHFEVETDDGAKTDEIWVDSISLVRRRVTPEMYQQRFRIKQY
ncbi:MAG: DUF4296 domain-containing protein [Muribaculaceae bacterium]|nr:DUF4296 domain-containing protein [Muribaculaceae bacterium]